MAIDPSKFRAPFIDQSKCCSAADSFRDSYWPSGEIPVDVITIAEIDLDLEIRTVSGLRENADSDALLLGNWKTILVDSRQYMDRKFDNRLRFSIAHELGHYVLHKQVFESIPRNTPRDWIEFMQKMPEGEYGFLEYHANEFAGRLLVPEPTLRAEFASILDRADDAGLSRIKLTDAHLGYLCNPLTKLFMVSQDVIERRLRREGLWPV